ncbi:unnamed protein product [Cuscuta campestris]|uniref:Uncharacterized protein n=1 Tax=Cuscuta campestris TaxID=132261 RepID=A0A484NNS2_9ASTE|nr:unnamed protein product [Cuscuta campestris]
MSSRRSFWVTTVVSSPESYRLAAATGCWLLLCRSCWTLPEQRSLDKGLPAEIVAGPLWSVTSIAAGTRRWIERCRVADLPEKNSLELMLGFVQTSSELAGSRFPDRSPSSLL